MEIGNIVGLCIGGILILVGIISSVHSASAYKKRIKEWSQYAKATATIKGTVSHHDQKGKYIGEIYTADLYVDGEMVDAIHCGVLDEKLLLRKGDEVKVYYRPCSYSDVVINTMDKMRDAFEAITGKDFKGEAPKYEFVIADHQLYRNEDKKCFLYPIGFIGLFGIIICILSFFLPSAV